MQFLKLWLILFLTLLSFNSQSFTVCGHRGARGLAPENTLPAFSMALKQGVDSVDMDITLTKDGILVVYHDLTLNPDFTRDHSGKWVKANTVVLNQITLKQLKTYTVGEINPKTRYAKLFSNQKQFTHIQIPTLKEVIDYVKKEGGDKVQFQIELKTDPTQPKWSPSPRALVVSLVQLLKQENILHRTRIQSSDWRCLQRLKQIDSNIVTAYITDAEQEQQMKNSDPKIAGLWTAGYLLKNYSSIPHMIKSLGGHAWDVQDTQLTQKDLKLAHQLGLKVYVWSWPEKTGKEIDFELIKQLIDWNVDGIITDRPDILHQIIYGSETE